MKNVLGFLASGAATIGLIISIGIWDTTEEWNVLVSQSVAKRYFVPPPADCNLPARFARQNFTVEIPFYLAQI